MQAIELIIVKDKEADVRANLRAKCSKRQHQRFDPYQVQSLIQTSFNATPKHRGRLKPAGVFLNELVPDHHLQPQSIRSDTLLKKVTDLSVMCHTRRKRRLSMTNNFHPYSTFGWWTLKKGFVISH